MKLVYVISKFKNILNSIKCFIILKHITYDFYVYIFLVLLFSHHLLNYSDL